MFHILYILCSLDLVVLCLVLELLTLLRVIYLANLLSVRGPRGEGGNLAPLSNFVIFKDTYLKFGDNVYIRIWNQSYSRYHAQTTGFLLNLGILDKKQTEGGNGH